MKKISFSTLIIEFLSVVFAVLLALGLNSYKQTIDAQREAERIKVSIQNECQRNLALLDSMMNVNQKYFTYLDSIVALPAKEQGPFHFSYQFEILTSGAWEIAQNNPAVNNLPQPFLIEVADIYQEQELVMAFSKDFIEKIGTFISEKERYKQEDMVLTAYYFINLIRDVSTDLKNKINQLNEGYPPTN